MNKKEVDLGISSLEELGKRFTGAWNKAEAGDEDVSEAISFENLEVLLRTLTPKRLELLKYLATNGKGLSIRKLAGELQRDYRNVHSDVSALSEIGLIEKTAEDLVFAPYKMVHAHLSLVA